MFLEALALGGLSMLSSARQSNAAVEQAANQAVQNIKQGTAALNQNAATNEAISKANTQNSLRTAFRVGLLNVQRGVSKRALLQKGADATIQGQNLLGALTADQAASGTIGASTEAMANQVRSKMAETWLGVKDQYELDSMNFDIQLGEVVQQGITATRDSARTPEVHTDVDLPSTSSILTNAAFSGLATFGSMYAMSGFGLGTSSASTGASAVPGYGSSTLGSGLSIGSTTGLHL